MASSLIFTSGYTIRPVSHTKNQRQADVKYLAQGHTARKWWGLDLNPGCQDPESLTSAVKCAASTTR